ncbi:hypothetical protein [Sphaerisporangium sp. TRM90804]|uniref:hypothetical protein n=1 Tax=Sphaerisporangium sp. TRM90804 TaxID=3031113 RepID=UPI0024492239|nr:hypothetical protein [Sphaerisporangium sp. TRM90804]MDH2424791.1 hypothetical protein [Sphaerisporangium sp. TRM90804]
MINNETATRLCEALYGVDVEEVQSRAARIWDQYKAEEIGGPEFVAAIEALEAELPVGVTIRFA